MTVIEQQTSGVGSNRSTNSATSTAHFFYFVNKIFGSLGHFHRQSLFSWGSWSTRRTSENNDDKDLKNNFLKVVLGTEGKKKRDRAEIVEMSTTKIMKR